MGALSTSTAANTSWREGEIGLLAAATGDIDVIADGAESVTTNHYIFATSSEGEIQKGNLTSGAATHDWLVPVYPLTGPDAGEFVTENVVTNSDVLLTAAQIAALFPGDTCGLWRDNTAGGVGAENGVFALDTNAAGGLKIVRILDSLGRDINQPDGDATDATAVVFATNA
jgi:hypothetical protein